MRAADLFGRLVATGVAVWVAFQAFDIAVNSGVGTAIRLLQRAVGVADDGHWGPRSRTAAVASPAMTTILKLNAYRLDYMTRLGGWPSFSRGWARRISANLRKALTYITAIHIPIAGLALAPILLGLPPLLLPAHVVLMELILILTMVE